MAYQVALSVRVEAMGAEWVLKPADKSEAKYSAWNLKAARENGDLIARKKAGEKIEDFEFLEVSPELMEDLVQLQCAWFIEACCGWDGVIHNGAELPYTRDTVHEIPTEAKIAVITALVAKRVEAAGNASAPSETPTEQPLPE